MIRARGNLRRSALEGDAFSRRLRIYFYTSSLEKLLQARLLFYSHGQTLNHFRATREPYEEDYTLSKEQLLRNAIAQVRNQFLVRSVFFVEDTSIRIESLSDKHDFPGLRAKEWFKEIDFYSLDGSLKAAGNDRRATVKSDIALHIPNLEEPFFFHGEMSGSISSSPPEFSPNPEYPWLTPETFNGWIIPEGAHAALGAMNLDESLKFDFRAKALNELLFFLRPLNAAANLPSSFFSRRGYSKGIRAEQPYLPHIFDPADSRQGTVICIVGHKCAGKTTASEFIKSNFGAVFFEASSELRAIAQDQGMEILSSNAARDFLYEFGHDVVSRQIIDQIAEDSSPLTVISGLRTVEEVELFYNQFSNVCTFLISADQRIRFERHGKRGRDEDVKTAHQFSELDEEQLSFGLLRVADEIADNNIFNEGEVGVFFKKIESAVHKALVPAGASREVSYASLSEFHRSLRALANIGEIASCGAISEESRRLGGAVWRYNTNRALKSVPLFVDRFDEGDELLSYRINDRGLRLLNLLEKRSGR